MIGKSIVFLQKTKENKVMLEELSMSMFYAIFRFNNWRDLFISYSRAGKNMRTKKVKAIKRNKFIKVIL